MSIILSGQGGVETIGNQRFGEDGSGSKQSRKPDAPELTYNMNSLPDDVDDTFLLVSLAFYLFCIIFWLTQYFVFNSFVQEMLPED